MASLDNVLTWDSDGPADAYVCGVGARTAVGFDAEASAAAVRAGISGFARHPLFTDNAGEPVTFAADAAISESAPLVERLVEMSVSTAHEALGSDSRTDNIDCCWLALPESRAGISPDTADAVVLGLRENLGLAAAVRVISRGHAGGLMAMQAAARQVASEGLRAVLVIGVDSYHDPTSILELDAIGRLRSPRNRGGFPVGEAAGACLIVNGAELQRRAVRPLAALVSAATAMEPQPLRSSEPCLGIGLTAAIRAVTSAAAVSGERVTDTYCDLNGERYRSEEFLYALLRTQHVFVNPHEYVSPADCWGDVGAASGPLFAVLAAVSGSRAYARGPIALLWAGSDEGYRSAVALRLSRN